MGQRRSFGSVARACTAFALLAACGDGPSTAARTEAEAIAPEATSCSATGTAVDRSLVVTDRRVLSRFSFRRVMNRIKDTAAVAPSETTLAIYQRWMATFGSCFDPAVDPERYGVICPRVNPQKLGFFDPFAEGAQVTFVPVALVNRIDLASRHTCGEYRIVYALRSSSFALFGRGFVIFEGALPLPEASTEPAPGACAPIARFWRDLTDEDDASRRADALEAFYFDGTAIVGVPPVVRAASYGLSADEAAGPGQIRTNFNVDFTQWHLREFKLARSCVDSSRGDTCSLAFRHETVKANPANELFSDFHPLAPAFQGAFVGELGSLLGGDLGTLRLSASQEFDEYESVSQFSDTVLYKRHASAPFRAAIAGELAARGSALTVDHVLARATTQTCAGCHELSNGASLGGGLTWPSSLGFVHVDEDGRLSQALRDVFLPHRKAVLEKFLEDQCRGGSATPLLAPGTTLGGSAEGAPN